MSVRAVFVLCCLVVAAALGAVLWQEFEHPCLRESPDLEIVAWGSYGDTLFPIVGHACLERK